MRENSTAPALELDRLHENLMNSTFAEDIFGMFPDVEPAKLKKEVKKSYHRFSRLCHPDLHNGNEVAAETFRLLNEWWAKAERLIDTNTYGLRRAAQNPVQETIIIRTRKAEYKVISAIGRGAISNIYQGEFTNDEDETTLVAIKIVNDKADNDLMQNEIRIIQKLRTDPSGYQQHLPVFVDQFRTTDGKVGCVLEYIGDSYDFDTIHQRYPNGVDSKHAVWMFKRLLSVLGYVHSQKIVHCNIEPAHILIRPRDHNAFLIDWSYAAYNPKHTREKFRVANDKYSPPEVLARKSPLPSSDLYSLAKCMVYILGGDIETKKFPAAVPKELQNFLKSLLLESPLQRTRYAWELLDELKKLNHKLWGPSKFREFVV